MKQKAGEESLGPHFPDLSSQSVHQMRPTAWLLSSRLDLLLFILSSSITAHFSGYYLTSSSSFFFFSYSALLWKYLIFSIQRNERKAWFLLFLNHINIRARQLHDILDFINIYIIFNSHSLPLLLLSRPGIVPGLLAKFIVLVLELMESAAERFHIRL